MSDLPWLVDRDFNEVLGDEDKSVSGRVAQSQVDNFLLTLDDCALEDMVFSGPCFMWNSGHQGDDLVQECLDHFICNHKWYFMFSSYITRHLSFWKSDHRPVLIFISKANLGSSAGFRRACWVSNKACGDMIQREWSKISVPDVMRDVVKWLLSYSQPLRRWNFDNQLQLKYSLRSLTRFLLM
ncbi:hypothetical protein ACOSP7_002296 [Xanthoceras sorbifolium]